MPVDDPLTGDAVDAGAVFKAKRNAVGLSIQEVAHSLKLTARLVAAIEANDRQRFPPTVYLRGFVRNYAKLLGLDPEPLLEAYPLDAPAAKEESTATTRWRPMRSLRQRLPQTIRLPLSLSVPLPVAVTAVGLTLTGLVLFLLLFWLSPASFDLFAIGTESTPASSETVSAGADPAATDGDREEPVARRDSPVADDTIPGKVNREEVIPQEAVGQEAVASAAGGEEAAAEPAVAGDADPRAGADGNLFPPGIFRGRPTADAEDSGTGAPAAQPGIEPGAASGVAAGALDEPLAVGDLLRVRRITRSAPRSCGSSLPMTAGWRSTTRKDHPCIRTCCAGARACG